MWMIDGNGILLTGLPRRKTTIKTVGESTKLKKNTVLYRITLYSRILKNFTSIDTPHSIGNIN